MLPSNKYFQFKQFTIHQDRCAMKVTTDACLLGAWAARTIQLAGVSNSQILDIGTGTGLLSLMIVQKNPQAEIDAIEIDHDSEIQATENVSASKWKKNINVIEGDIKSFRLKGEYDVIISNPPFYEKELASPHTRKNVAHHDLGLKLDDLLIIIKRNLKNNGKFFLLSSYKRNEELEELITKQNLFISEKLLVRQTENHPFSRLIISGSRNNDEKIKTSEISIRDLTNHYTFEFTELLKEYYLNL